MLLIAVYVMLSAGGLVLLKIGANRGIGISMKKSNIEVSLNLYLILGLMLYICAFVTSLIAMSNLNLNVFYPISAGLVYILVCFISYFGLKEPVNHMQLIGMLVILLGVILMNLK